MRRDLSKETKAMLRGDRLFLAAALLFAPALGGYDDARTPARRTGSDVYIQQPPRKALERKEPGFAVDGNGETLKPAQGPVLPPGQPSTVCGPQNVTSQACYTATQQARPIPR